MFDKLSRFVKSLFPDLPAERVLSQLKQLKEECLAQTLPIYRNVYEDKLFTKRNPFKSKFGHVFDKVIMDGRYGKVVKGELHSLDVIYQVLVALPERIDMITQVAEKNLGKMLVQGTITYPQATIVRIAEVISFMLVYSRRVLNHLMAEEYALLPDARKQGGYSEKMIKWIENHSVHFRVMLEIFSSSSDEFMSKLRSIPDIVVEEDPEAEEAVIAHTGANQIDPFKLGFIPMIGLWVYRMRSMAVDHEQDRLDAARTEREMVAVRLQQFIMKRDGQENAQLDTVIENLEIRLQKLDIKIAKYEAAFIES